MLDGVRAPYHANARYAGPRARRGPAPPRPARLTAREAGTARRDRRRRGPARPRPEHVDLRTPHDRRTTGRAPAPCALARRPPAAGPERAGPREAKAAPPPHAAGSRPPAPSRSAAADPRVIEDIRPHVRCRGRPGETRRSHVERARPARPPGAITDGTREAYRRPQRPAARRATTNPTPGRRGGRREGTRRGRRAPSARRGAAGAPAAARRRRTLAESLVRSAPRAARAGAVGAARNRKAHGGGPTETYGRCGRRSAPREPWPEPRAAPGRARRDASTPDRTTRGRNLLEYHPERWITWLVGR